MKFRRRSLVMFLRAKKVFFKLAEGASLALNS